jgi:DNA-binding NtrC family response regulator
MPPPWASTISRQSARPRPEPPCFIVDDQPAVRTALDTLFEVHDLPALSVGTMAEALDLIASEDIGAVVQDMNYTQNKTSGEEGVELFRAIRALDPEMPVLMMTAWASLETAVALIKEGATDYMAKPWNDDKLVATVRNLVNLRALKQENVRLHAQARRARRALAEGHDLCKAIYESAEMHAAVRLAVTVAPSDAPVLITGPNGSGKEKLAEIVQANSRRKDKPFVKVNVGALPDSLFEAELFGAEAGAFTGAQKMRVGRFEVAHGGTLFLDEMGTLSAAAQAKLLRVLQTGEYERLGSSTTRKADVRIISATNTDLPKAIADGSFREDLFFRLNVIELHVPALADRPDDIRPLAQHFLAEWAVKERKGECISPRMRWPRLWATNGRATCASCRTASSVRCWSRPGCASPSKNTSCPRPHGADIRERNNARSSGLLRSACLSGP